MMTAAAVVASDVVVEVDAEVTVHQEVDSVGVEETMVRSNSVASMILNSWWILINNPLLILQTEDLVEVEVVEADSEIGVDSVIVEDEEVVTVEDMVVDVVADTVVIAEDSVEEEAVIAEDMETVVDEEVVRLLGNAATFKVTFAVIPLIIFLYCSDRGRDRARPY